MSIQIKKLEDLNDLEKISLTDFSYSRIDTYKTCPSKYFFSYIQKEPRIFGEAATLGNIVHSVLEEHVSAEKLLDQKEMHQSYSLNLSSYDPEGKINEDLVAVGKEIINEFYDEYAETKFDVLEKELGFKFVIGSYLITGYIDRVDSIDENTLKIIDYKTGKWEVSAKDVPNNLQLGIYAVAVDNLYPQKDVYAELYYLRSGRRKGHFFTKEDIENIKTNLVSILETILSDTAFLPTKNERACTYCDFAKSGACNTGVFRLKKFAKA